MEENKNNDTPKTTGEKIKENVLWLLPYVIAIAVVLFLKSYIFILANIPSGSMLNTLQLKDKVFGNRLAYKNKEPERGDIIIFWAPDEPDTLYIKRVIGLPGEKVVIKDAKVYINDAAEPLNETYLLNKWVSKNDGLEYNVPQDGFFVMGDNRNGSFDARSWDNTYVMRDAIVAKAIFVYWPFRNAKWINSYEY